MATSRDSDTRSAIDKTFDILRCFRPEEAAGIGVSEIARRAKLPKSTTHRILGVLVRNGAVQRADSVYRLGPLMYELTSESIGQDGETVRHDNLISEVLTPFLSALFERTRATVHLARMEGTDVVYANKLFSVRGVAAPSRIGGCVPGFCTGVGKAMMAYQPELIDLAIAQGLPRWTPKTITRPEVLRATLAKAREVGYAFDREENTLGLHCVAAPIFGRGGVPVAAMSVSGPTVGFAPEDHIQVLLKLCGSASKAYQAALQVQERAEARAAASGGKPGGGPGAG